jgi:hypothetical protein
MAGVGLPRRWGCFQKKLPMESFEEEQQGTEYRNCDSFEALSHRMYGLRSRWLPFRTLKEHGAEEGVRVQWISYLSR